MYKITIKSRKKNDIDVVNCKKCFLVVNSAFSSVFGLIRKNEAGKIIVDDHRMLKLDTGNWKLWVHAFILLMNSFNLGPSLSIMVFNS